MAAIKLPARTRATQKRLIRHYERVEASLNKLRAVLADPSDAQTASGYLRFFDEMMEHREYGLALDAICDFALEPSYKSLSAELVDELISLHIAMELDDDCGMKLKAKLRNSA